MLRMIRDYPGYTMMVELLTIILILSIEFALCW